MSFNPSNYDIDKAYRREQESRAERQRMIDNYVPRFEHFRNLPALMQASIISTAIVALITISLMIFFFTATGATV